MAKRVLIFSLAYYPKLIGGAEVATKEITDRISPGEIEFDMITLRAGESSFARIGNVNVHRVGSDSVGPLGKYLFIFQAAWKAARLHRAAPYDMIWSMMANYAGFAALFFKLFHMQTPFLLTLQEGDPIEHIERRVRPVAPIFRMIFTHADRIQAISRYLADFAKSKGARAEPIVIGNGVDVAHFSEEVAEAELSAWKAKLGKGPEDAFLITTSRLVEKNGVGDIIDSLNFLPKEVKLLILGTGPLEADLRAKAARQNLTDRVRFVGFVPHEEMPKYLKVSDVFVRPSLSEGFGNSFIEAMAAGIPVIATPVGGIPDFLENKRTGLFCDVRSPEDVARKAMIYLRDKLLADEIVDHAIVMVSERYDWDVIARKMKEEAFGPLLSR